MIHTERARSLLLIDVPDKWKGLSLEMLVQEYWQAPKKMVHSWRMAKSVTVNGEPAVWTKPLEERDVIGLPIFEDETPQITPVNLGLDVLYEDDHLLIINKPAGMDTHPGDPGQTNTALNGAAWHLQATGQSGYIKHVHRLDRDTTGAVLFAKNRFAGALMDKQLEERRIKRTYLALVHGLIKEDSLTIRDNIGRDRHHPTRRRVSSSGQTAVTHVRVLSRFPTERLSLVCCTLESGRTHQIRVHLSHIAHPLAGDLLYGGTPLFQRQSLHAYKMELSHPLTEETICCTAPFLDEPPIFPPFLPAKKDLP